jgi:hypothetical protein
LDVDAAEMLTKNNKFAMYNGAVERNKDTIFDEEELKLILSGYYSRKR